MELKSQPMAFMTQLDQAANFANELHDGRTFLDTASPHISYLRDVATAVRFAGGDITQAVAGYLHDSLALCGDERPQLADEIEAEFGASVRAIVETCTPPIGDGRPWHQRRQTFFEQLASLDDGDPALLVFLVATNCKLELIHAKWASKQATILSALPGRGAREKLIGFCELAMLFRARLPGRVTDRLSRHAQSLRNHVSDARVPVSPDAAFPYLRRKLYEALGDKLEFLGDGTLDHTTTMSGAHVTFCRNDLLEVRGRQEPIFRTTIKPEESHLETMAIVRIVYIGETPAEQAHINERLTTKLRDLAEPIKERFLSAGFELDPAPIPKPDDDMYLGTGGKVLFWSVTAHFEYDSRKELIDVLGWLADEGPGVDAPPWPGGFKGARFSVR